MALKEQLAGLVCLLLVGAASAAICPYTFQEPVRTTIPPLRCPDAANQTCCDNNCTDLGLALEAATASLGGLVAGFAPALAGSVNTLPSLRDSKACSLFQGYHNCERYLEALLCGLTCNPDSGTYATASSLNANATLNISICSNFSNVVYSACSVVPLNIPGIGSLGQLSTLFTTPQEFLATVFSGLVVANGGPSLIVSIVNSTAGCYNGPKNPLPTLSLCCDPLTITPTCAPYVNASDYNMTGRTYLTDTTCKAQSTAPVSAPTAAPTTATAPVASATQTNSTATGGAFRYGATGGWTLVTGLLAWAVLGHQV